MPIILDEPHGSSSPVVKRTALGQTFIGALVQKQQRSILKDGREVLKPDTNKPRQEMVLTVVTMPGTTAPAGIGDYVGVPEPGDVVRIILRGKAFGQYIEGVKGQPLQVGDVVTQTTSFGQAYNEAGKPDGPPLTTEAAIAAIPRSKTLGIYGDFEIRRATAAEQPWVTAAEDVYMAATATPLAADVPAYDDEEAPFVADAADWNPLTDHGDYPTRMLPSS